MSKFNVMEIKEFTFKSILASFLSYISPIHNELNALLIVIVINLAVGLWAGRNIQGEKFSFEKFFDAFKQSAVIMILVASIYVVGKLKGDESGSLVVVSVFVYMAILMYAQNVSKNLNRLWPENRLFAVLYFILSAEWIRITNKINQKYNEINSRPNQEDIALFEREEQNHLH